MSCHCLVPKRPLELSWITRRLELTGPVKNKVRSRQEVTFQGRCLVGKCSLRVVYHVSLPPTTSIFSYTTARTKDPLAALTLTFGLIEVNVNSIGAYT